MAQGRGREATFLARGGRSDPPAAVTYFSPNAAPAVVTAFGGSPHSVSSPQPGQRKRLMPSEPGSARSRPIDSKACK
jgi:hypothetical protein